MVDPPKELQPAVRAPSGQVAGPVHPPAAAGGHEPGRGQPGPAEVAPGDLGSGEVQLADHARRDRFEPLVQHVRARPGQRLPDGSRPPSVHLVPGGPDGHLGRAVQVGHAARPLGQRAGQADRQRLPADQGTHVAQVNVGGEQRGPQRGGRLHGGDPLVADHPGQQLRIADLLGRGQHDGATGPQRPEQFEHRDVERQGGHSQQPFAGLQRHGGQERLQVAVGDHDALRAAGRAGGVDDVRGRVRWPGDHRRGARRDPVEIAQDQRGLGVGDHEVQSRGRERRVEGQVGGARPEHAQHRHDQVGRAGHGDAHDVLGPDPPGGQHGGDRVGGPVQLGVAHPDVAADQRLTGRVDPHGGRARQAGRRRPPGE